MYRFKFPFPVYGGVKFLWEKNLYFFALARVTSVDQEFPSRKFFKYVSLHIQGLKYMQKFLTLSDITSLHQNVSIGKQFLFLAYAICFHCPGYQTKCLTCLSGTWQCMKFSGCHCPGMSPVCCTSPFIGKEKKSNTCVPPSKLDR